MNEATRPIAIQEGSLRTEKLSVARAYAAQSPTSEMAPFTIRRRTRGCKTLRSIFCTAGYVIRICTRCVISGKTRCPQFIPVSQATRLLGVC